MLIKIEYIYNNPVKAGMGLYQYFTRQAKDRPYLLHALSENLILATNNTNEFGRIPGLSLQNWAE